jgi:hypothetical protein
MANGEVSPLFPKDLTALFGLDGIHFPERHVQLREI